MRITLTSVIGLDGFENIADFLAYLEKNGGHIKAEFYVQVDQGPPVLRLIKEESSVEH